MQQAASFSMLFLEHLIMTDNPIQRQPSVFQPFLQLLNALVLRQQRILTRYKACAYVFGRLVFASRCHEGVLLLQLRLIKESRSATMEEVTAVHEADYIQQLKDTADNKAPTVVADFDDPDGFTYMTSTSYDDALKVTVPAGPLGPHQRYAAKQS